MRTLQLSLMIAALGALNACAGKSMYYWGRYEELIHQMYAKPGTAEPGTQVAKLTEDIEKARAEGKPLPPGFHAHLGYLYYQQGNLGGAHQEFQTEKTLFPESATFIDGIFQRMGRR